MPARLLDGTAVAQRIREELRPGVERFTTKAGRPPGLGLVLVGDDPASALYVTSKLKSAGWIKSFADRSKCSKESPRTDK